MLNQRHALYRLASQIDWNAAEEQFGNLYSEEGRPGIPIRLMVRLHYLKHTYFDQEEAQTQKCSGAGDRAHEERWTFGAELPQRRSRGCDQRAAVRRRPQPAQDSAPVGAFMRPDLATVTALDAPAKFERPSTSDGRWVKWGFSGTTT